MAGAILQVTMLNIAPILLSQSNSKILHFHVATVNETNSSVAMGKYSLVKVLDKLQYWGLDITCITTDDHQSIKKYLKDKPCLCHQLDIWHRSKNIKTKITKLAKSKTCIELHNWIKALINRFW